ncbi:unnamed protein product [Diabrotica balteata]|uniref:UDP-glucuronosyltransferase n=1 Tax=Diabrotica balteata TaxID=107213 RepID=A0A9N9SUB4_DIABA|nr:unnamed protein product [Diabrotica balteata]
MRFNIKFAIILFCNVLGLVNSSNILLVFNHFGKSHYFQGKSLGHGLARAGHNVTMVSVFQDNQKVPGYEEIYLDGMISSLGIDTNFVKASKLPALLIQVFFHSMALNFTEKTLSHPKFQELLNSNKHFDAIILEDVVYTALKALSWHFKAPLILFSPFAPMTTFHITAGNSAPPSYIPNTLNGYSSPMNFWQRSYNSFVYLVDVLLSNFLSNPNQEALMKKYFPGCPDLAAIDKNISLFLINDHESINAPISHVPSMIDILGFHLKDKNELPNNLQKYMDAAKEGVILFSFGSFVNPSKMDPQIKESFLNSLGKLSQKVLWKTDEDNISGKPDNVILHKWLPQEDILAHPNCKLFITHAGFLSTIETIYHEVPVLAIPFVADQDLNALRMVDTGVGLSTKLHDITEPKLDFMLHELLYNKTYTRNVQKRSRLMKDRPVKPMDLAVYWVEYVIRHKDLSHMRVAGLELTWYQYLLLDVILVWSMAAVSGTIIIFYTLKLILCKRSKKIKTN